MCIRDRFWYTTLLHFSEPPLPHPRWDVINVQSLISRIWGNSLHAIRTYTVFTRLTALGAYYIFGPWEWALIRGWALIKFSTFSASVVCLFRNKTINSKTKREDVTKQGFCKILCRKLRLPGSLLLVPRAILWLLLVLIQCLGGAMGKGVGVGAYSRLGAYSRWALIRGWALMRIFRPVLPNYTFCVVT